MAECVEKATYLRNHPRQRLDIATAGRRRALTCHTYDQRAAELEAWIAPLL